VAVAYYIIKSLVGAIWVIKAREKSDELLADDNALLLKRYNHMSLEPFIDVRCISRGHINRFYDEGEFLELMERIISRCYMSREYRERALRWIMRFVREPTFEEITDGGHVFFDSDDLHLYTTMPKQRYDLSLVVFYLFDEFFCFYHRGVERSFCSPYDAENVSVDAVARMTDFDARIVREAVDRVLNWPLANTTRFVPMTRDVKRAVETCKYILALYELLGGRQA